MYEDILKGLHVTPRDYKLYKAAVTHRSYANEKGLKYDYQRLEFVGDAIISKIAAVHLFEKGVPTEGEMTNAKSLMVQSKSLARACKESGLSESILLGKGESGVEMSQNIAEDVFEAFCGALYFDAGEDCVKALLEKTIFKYYDGNGHNSMIDEKTRLQEYLQTFSRMPIVYKVDKDGMHDHAYRVSVWSDGCCYGSGEGKSKKEAERAAAGEALQTLATVPSAELK